MRWRPLHQQRKTSNSDSVPIMEARLQRLKCRPLPLLLACLLVASSILVLAHEARSGLHPVVLVPGYSCSSLDTRLTDAYRPPPATPWCGELKGKGWFRLWEDYTAVQDDPNLVPCFADQLRLVYDYVAGDYRNVKGVQTRVVAFGATRGFGSEDDPAQRNKCLEKLVKALEGVGYREGKNLFGAPYDFRHAAAPPGQTSKVFSNFLSRLRRLVELASARNGGKPAILVSHSLGGFNVNEFLSRNPLPWRRRYVKHFVMVSLGDCGAPVVLQILAAGINNAPPPPDDLLSFANTSRSFASIFRSLPSPTVHGQTPLVLTPAKNFSAYDIPEFLTAIGFSEREVLARYVKRALPVILNFRAPLVPVTSITGVGVPTVTQLVYSDGDFRANPQLVYGDGDGTIDLESVLALRSVFGEDPDQGYFKFVFIPNTTHTGIIMDDFALNSLVTEILEANQPTISNKYI